MGLKAVVSYSRTWNVQVLDRFTTDFTISSHLQLTPFFLTLNFQLSTLNFSSLSQFNPAFADLFAAWNADSDYVIANLEAFFRIRLVLILLV